MLNEETLIKALRMEEACGSSEHSFSPSWHEHQTGYKQTFSPSWHADQPIRDAAEDTRERVEQSLSGPTVGPFQRVIDPVTQEVLYYGQSAESQNNEE